MLGKRLINSNDAAAGGACTTNTNDYPTTNVAYYKMSSAADEKDTYNGTPSNVNFNVQGKFGNAAEFNGSSSYIDTNAKIPVSLDFSVSVWINTSSTASQFIFDTKSGYTTNGWRISINAGAIIYAEGNGVNNATSQTSPSSTYADGNWHHVCITRVAGGTVNMYIDNSRVITNGSVGTYYMTSSVWQNNLQIGKYSGGSTAYLNGSLDQVRIFDSALNATQVESLYNEVYCVPTIVPSESFNTVLYTGNGGTQSITGVGFQPDFTWIKSRNAVGSHIATDSVRGNGKEIYTDLTNAQGTVNRISLTSTGFDVVSAGYPNQTNNTFVSWNWKAGGAAVSNTDGTITSQVSANVDAGFSIVEYSGTNSVTDTVGHGLSETPEMVIVKNTSASKSWAVRHAVLASTQNIFLNATNGATTITATATGGVGVINSTTFGFAAGGTNASNVNISGNDFIAYCFHSVDGFSKIGSYTGTGATGNTIVTGFRPAFVMIKQTSSIGADNHWNMWDNKRVEEDMLRANTNSSEFAGPGRIDFLSNGFEMLDSDTSRNTSGGTYIFMAFAEEALPIVTRNATNPFGDSSELALYKFEDNANDAEGNYNGTASNVTYASGYIDKAAVFNGLQTSSASYIDISSATTTPVSSISFWFKTTVKNSTNANILAAGGSSSTRTGFSIRRNSSGFLNVQFTKGTPGSTQTVTGNQDITDGVWHNFILSMASDNTFVVYLDGQSHISGTRTHFTNGQSRSQSINRFGSDSVAIGANAFDGSIDQVRIFDRALDDGEVTALYNE